MGVSLAVVVTGIVGIIGSVQLNQRIMYAFGTLLVIFFLLQGIVGGVFLVYNKTVRFFSVLHLKLNFLCVPFPHCRI